MTSHIVDCWEAMHQNFKEKKNESCGRMIHSYTFYFYFFPAAVIARVAASPRKYVSIIANRLLSIQMSLVGLEMCLGCATLRYVFYVRPSPLSFEKSHPKYKWQSVGGSFFFRCNHLLFLSQKGGEKKRKKYHVICQCSNAYRYIAFYVIPIQITIDVFFFFACWKTHAT